MGFNHQEWEFYVSDRGQTTGGSPPDIDDDSGVLFACTVDSADSPTVYSDANGTTLTETQGHALISLTNGHCRFWTDKSVTNLDIYWFGSNTAGMLKNAHFSRHELPGNANGQPCISAIPVGNHGIAAASSVGNKGEGPFSTGWTPASNVTCLRAWAQIISAGNNTASSHLTLGTSGLSNAFFSINTSAVSSPGNRVSAYGAYSVPYTFSGTEAVTFAPNSESNSAVGALMYMELQYSNYPVG